MGLEREGNAAIITDHYSLSVGKKRKKGESQEKGEKEK